MKRFSIRLAFTILSFFLLHENLACECANYKEFSIEDVNGYDYVALVKINNTAPMDTTQNLSETRPWYYLASIQELKVFKGPSISKLKIMMGNHKFGYSTSCDLGIDNEEEWLIFGNLNNDQIEVNSCTPTSQFKIAGGGMDWQYDRTLKKIKILESLLEE